jgi:methylenetetrahydrofolate dehydrogenase (NADP+)/methenyltetrahydrofolate cyclohydrolase
MTAKIIDGKAVAARLRGEVAQQVTAFRAEHGRAPGLATVLVGDDPASHTYVGGKRKACAETGIESFHHELPAELSQEALLELVEELNNDERVDGILVQVPLPKQISEKAVIEAILPEKDVDGFHPYNLGLVAAGQSALESCTPRGVVRLLDEYEIPLAGARVTIVGRSANVGRALALLLINRHATVTVAHSRTRDLPGVCREADVLVVATGRPGLVTANMVKPGSAVVDVGITRTDAGLRGDVDFDAAREVAGYITPVPGGVGPMTIATLLSNTVEAARRREAAVAV